MSDFSVVVSFRVPSDTYAAMLRLKDEMVISNKASGDLVSAGVFEKMSGSTFAKILYLGALDQLQKGGTTTPPWSAK